MVRMVHDAGVEDSHQTSPHKASMFRWLADVREIWPSPVAESSKTTTGAWGETLGAKRPLATLLPGERARVLRFFHVRDAKMCLASYLLKRRAIVHACDVPWALAILSEDHHRRPYYQPQVGSETYFDFNVSHHGTMVALVGCTTPKVRVGVDVVQIPWEKELPLVLRDGFENWITTYRDIFSTQELEGMIRCPEGDERHDVAHAKMKLRRFYTHWCLKEAFIKMKGRVARQLVEGSGISKCHDALPFGRGDEPRWCQSLGGSKHQGRCLAVRAAFGGCDDGITCLG